MNVKLFDSIEIKKAFDWLASYLKKPVNPYYYDAGSLDEAVALLNRHGEGAQVLAGGVDIVGLIKNRVLAPTALVNIKNIPELRYVRETERGLEIGALTTIDDVQRSDLIRNKYSVLYEAACLIGSPQVRNMGTVGGNLLQDVRCWYYRRSPDTGNTFNCRRKSERGICYALNGENQYHALFGIGDCCAVCPSDMATVLAALDARVETVGASGGRSIQIDELYTTLGNTLEHGEVIKSISIPHAHKEAILHYIKFRVRKAIDFAIVSAATNITLNDDVVEDARIVLGGVACKPWRVNETEEMMKGKPLGRSIVGNAVRAGLAGAAPLSKNEYKLDIAETMLKRAIMGEV